MSVLREFLSTLPKTKFSFTYGSSYLIAPSGKDSSAQIDLILSVEDTFSWHRENIEKNQNHYSSKIRFFGTDYLVNSSHQGAGIHFNPYVDFQGLTLKYGVIHHDHLKDDLKEWNTFYVAGRMQKPVQVLIECQEIEPLIKNNCKMALIVGNLIGNSLVHESDLYMNICRLSYFGDWRIDDPKKIYNLVFGNLEKFKELYRPLINETVGLRFDNEFIERSPEFYSNLSSLPPFLSKVKDIEDMNTDERYSLIMEIFKKNNGKFSGKQILHTLKTGSLSQILKYSYSKLKKSVKSDNKTNLH
jgi:translocator assembly and maintenance protein 41